MVKIWMFMIVALFALGAVLSVGRAQSSQPFQSYETQSACVYISDYSNTAHIFVIPKKELLKHGSFEGC